MPTEHILSTSRYLTNSEGVLAAGRQLEGMLGEELETLDYAVTRLEEAAKEQDIGAINYRAFMFSELTKEVPREKRQRVSEDVFATVLVDLQVANVLMAAGDAVGEITGKKESQRLAEALNELEETTPVISRGLASPIAKGATPGRFNFSGVAVKTSVINSVDLESAIETYRKLSNETLDKLVGKVHEVALSVFEAMKKLTLGKIVEALNALGEPVQKITDMIGRLFRQGLQKMQNAIDDLARLVGGDAITKIKDKVKEIWDARQGGLIANLIAKIMGVNETRDQIVTILALKGIDKTVTDEASNDLSQLLNPFVNNAEIAKKTVGAISFATGVLFLTPIAGQQIALFAASSYLVILSVVVLIGMDYADSGRILKRVRGVGEITNGLRPMVATAGPAAEA